MSAVVESSHRLFVRTVPVPDDQALLARLPDGEPTAFVHRGEGLIGWGEAARLVLPAEAPETETAGKHRFAEARRWLASLMGEARIEDGVGLPGCGPVAFASFTFDPASPGSVLIVPRVIMGRRAGRTWLTTIEERAGTGPSTPEHLVGVSPRRPIGELRWTEGELGPHRWGRAVAEAVRRIRRGDVAKVVLSRDLRAEAATAIDTRTVLARLARDFPDCYTFSVAGLVGATPELLVRRGTAQGDQDALESLVLAGTRPRGATTEEDAALAAELRSSGKDVEEHRYAVESLRTTLAPLCSRLHIPEQPQILRVRNVQHLASPVRATLRPEAATLDVVAALHPTAAVGGTPTREAVALIRELEGMDRGRYAGPVGWIDHRGRGEWGIALRTAQLDGNRARLYAGGGIVADSDPRAEIAEADAKFRVMREALLD